MTCFLYKLHFITAVHFGSSDSAQSLNGSEYTVCADTLFSALCIEALRMYGAGGIEHLVTSVQKNKLILSDTMPWGGSDYYLPKPYIAQDKMAHNYSTSQQRIFDRIRWLPVTAFITHATLPDMCCFPDFTPLRLSFGKEDEITRTLVNPTENQAKLYNVGIFRFYEDCGLWFLARFDGDAVKKRFETLLQALSFDGIGGKVSSGLGKFEISDILRVEINNNTQVSFLAKALCQSDGKKLLLTTSLPNDGELETVMRTASYRLIRRGGYIQSDNFSDTQMKKKTEYYFAAGSVFNTVFEGGVREVSNGGKHPVYRYSKPLFMGVNL